MPRALITSEVVETVLLRARLKSDLQTRERLLVDCRYVESIIEILWREDEAGAEPASVFVPVGMARKAPR